MNVAVEREEWNNANRGVRSMVELPHFTCIATGKARLSSQVSNEQWKACETAGFSRQDKSGARVSLHNSVGLPAVVEKKFKCLGRHSSNRKENTMATETTTAPVQERTAQVRIHLRTEAEDIQLPDTGPILVSTGKAGVVRRTYLVVPSSQAS